MFCKDGGGLGCSSRQEVAHDGVAFPEHEPVVDQHRKFGQYNVVVINRGSRDGLEAGNVLSIWKAGMTVKDETKYRESSKVDLPENMIGRFMVFKTWDRLSYGLVLDSARELDIGDKVRNP